MKITNTVHGKWGFSDLLACRKIWLIIILACVIVNQSSAQQQRNYSLYLQSQYTKTLYDVTKGNNPWGMGLGMQLFVANNSRLRPTIDFTTDVYLEDDKVYRMNSDGTEIIDVRGMVNSFAGVSFYPTKTTFLSIVAGPSFVSRQTLLGVKPFFGFYFSSSQKWVGKLSYINIFNRYKKTGEDFGSISFSLGVKLF